MANQFSFVGNLRAIRETDSFKALDTRSFDSGWVTSRFRSNIICGNSSFLVEVNAGSWRDVTKNVIYTYTKAVGDKSGENIQVAYADRLKPEIVAKVAEFKKFVLDTALPSEKKAARESKDEKALAAIAAKRKEFIYAGDFLEAVQKLVNNPKAKEMLWNVKGEVKFTYSQKTGLFYRTFEINKIYRAEVDAVPSSTGNYTIYFGEDCVDSESYDDTKKHLANVYVQTYDGFLKKNIFAPVTLVIDGSENEKKATGMKKLLSKAEGEELKELGVAIEFIDGAPTRAITYDDLSEEQKDNVDCGLVTLEDIQREFSNGIKGDRIQETRISGLLRGYSGGPQDTAYTKDDLAIVSDTPVEDKTDDVDTDDSDIFDTEDEDDLI